MNWDTIRDEVVTLLQDLIRFDTTNPPGNETPCIEYIATILRREGSRRSYSNLRRGGGAWWRG